MILRKCISPKLISRIESQIENPNICIAEKGLGAFKATVLGQHNDGTYDIQVISQPDYLSLQHFEVDCIKETCLEVDVAVLDLQFRFASWTIVGLYGKVSASCSSPIEDAKRA